MAKRKMTDVILFSLVILILSVMITLLFWKIFYPARLSVQNSCGFISEEEFADTGYYIAGSVSQTYENDETYIQINFIDDTRTIRHEVCHLKQIEENRLNDCYEPRKVWLDEVECYLKQYLPIYNDEIEALRGSANEDIQI